MFVLCVCVCCIHVCALCVFSLIVLLSYGFIILFLGVGLLTLPERASGGEENT